MSRSEVRKVRTGNAPSLGWEESMWNRIEVLTDEAGGDRAVHYAMLEDPPELVATFYTRERFDADCLRCADGTCIQRVVVNDAWESDLVVHDCGGELS